ncbi:MAG: flagellar basal body rod protein FlgB, partial [Nitrospirae bacterium]
MDDIFGALEKLIDFTSFRHKVLASNIANVDTPNYKAKDVVFRSVFDAEALKLIGTDEQHIVSQKQGNGEKVIYENTSQWGDGNNVE